MSFAIPALLALFERELDLDGVTYLSDPDRALYRALGLGRGSVRRVWLDPRVWRRYLALIARGRRPVAPAGADTLQLGGDVVLDAAGAVTWRCASRGPEDRPSFAQVRAAALAARGG